MKNLNTKNSSASKTMKTYITLKQRIVGTFMALFMLLQLCIPGIASAAIIISDDSITKAMTSQLFELSTDTGHMYKQASYLSNQAVVAKTVTDLYNELRAAKVPVGAPKYVPIAGDVTVFVPYYTPGKLIGDTYVQTRYIRDQITDLLGRHMIDAANDADEYIQIKRLYDNAKTFAINNSATYKFGDNLPATLTITLDMIWPERRVINGQSVVVPIVYLKPETIAKYQVNDHKIEFLGGTAEFKSIVLEDVKLTTGRESVIKTGQLLSYNGSVTSGGNLTLMVGGTLNNIGGAISVAGNLNIIAGQLNNKTVVVPYADKFGSGTRLGRVAKIEAGNNLNVYSKNDIVLEGSTLKSVNGSITLNAGGNINIAPVYIQNQGTSKEGQWQVSSSSLNVYGSKLTAAENIKLIADGAVNITASELIATKGGIEILASQGIHVLDELNQEQIQKVDRKGKTKGQSSEFRTEAVRAVLNSGKGVLLDSEHGDVVLKATDIASTSGTQVTARNGKVHLLMTKELEEFHLQTVRKGTWTIKTKTVDIVHENNIQNTIVGGLQVQAKYGINVEYTGKEGATLKEQIEEFRRMPGMEWMATLYDQSLSSAGQSVNWEVMEEVHKELRKTKRNLSPAAMAIIAIAVSIVTAGAGAALVGAAQGSMYAAVANAAVTTLATQATQSLAAGNSLSDTLKTMASDESLKSLAISMVTAGAMQHTDLEMFKVADDAKKSIEIMQQAGQAFVNSAVSAGISVAINGGNTKDFENAFVQSLAMSAVSAIGEKMANKIGEAAKAKNINDVVKYLAHAGAGCVIGVASAAASGSGDDNKYTCFSGAGGAVVGEFIAEQYKEHVGIKDLEEAEYETRKWLEENGLTTQMTDEQYNALTDAQKKQLAELAPARFISASEFADLKAKGVDLAKLGAGLAAFAAGADVSIAAQTAENAAQNNAFHLVIIGAYYAYRAYQAYTFVESVVQLGQKINDIVNDRASFPTEEEFNAALEQAIVDFAIEKGLEKLLGGKRGSAALKMISDNMKSTGVGKGIAEELDKVIDALDNNNKYQSTDNKSVTNERLPDIKQVTADKVSIDSNKYKYIFGHVDSSEHNAARSKQLAAEMERLGIPENSYGYGILSEHIEKSAKTAGNIVDSYTDQWGTFEIRESLLIGPSGKGTLCVTSFQVLEDGTRKFTTLITKAGKK